MGVRRDCPFFEYSLLSQERVKLYELQIWQIHSHGPSEQKSIKHFGENGAWAFSGTSQFLSTPYCLRNG